MKKILILLFILFITFYIFAMPSIYRIKPKNYDLLKSKGIDMPEKRQGKVSGTWNAIIILIDFQDYKWDNQSDSNFTNDSLYYDSAHYYNMLSSLNTYRHPESNSSYTGSMRDFYLENSYNQFDIISAISIWYTAPNNYSYYCNTDGIIGTSDDYGFGAYPNNVQKLVEDAIALADSNIDFSLYDNDGDGYVDALFVVHAGPGAEALPSGIAENYIWSHKWSINSQLRDGVYISSYSMEPEDGNIGVFCHEFGHILGLPDLYDTDYSSSGIGDWGVMSFGSWGYKAIGDSWGSSPVHFTAPSKIFLEWINPIEISTNAESIIIPPVETNAIAYKLWDNGNATNEYFIIENRQNKGFDASLTTRQITNSFSKAHGLLIYHIDTNISSNTNENHRLVDVKEASPIYYNGNWIENMDYPTYYPNYLYLYNGNCGDNGDPWPGYDSLTSDSMNYLNRNKDYFNFTSIPNSNDYNDNITLVGVENIIEQDTFIIADLLVGINSLLIYPDTLDTVFDSSVITIDWKSRATGCITWDSLFYSYYGDSNWYFLSYDTDSIKSFDWQVVRGISDSCYVKIIAGNIFGQKNEYISHYFIINEPGLVRELHKGTKDISIIDNNLYFNVNKINAIINDNKSIYIYDITGRSMKAISKSGIYLLQINNNIHKVIIIQ